MAMANTNELMAKAEQAILANDVDIAECQAFIAIVSPTNAQNAAAVKELARQSVRQAKQLNNLLRWIVGRLDDLEEN